MRVGLCLKGKFVTETDKDIQGKTKKPGKYIKLAYEFLKRNLLSINEVDIFVHCWDGGFKEKIKEDYNPIRAKYDSEKIVTDTYKNPRTRSREPKRLDRIMCNWYSTMASVDLLREYEIENNFKYDVVIITRFDAVLMKQLRFPIQDTSLNDTIYHSGPQPIHGKGPNHCQRCNPALNTFELGDLYFFSNSDNMYYLSRIYKKHPIAYFDRVNSNHMIAAREAKLLNLKTDCITKTKEFFQWRSLSKSGNVTLSKWIHSDIRKSFSSDFEKTIEQFNIMEIKPEDKNKITAVIPIRGGSTRCRHKSIRKFGDTTLLELRINILKSVKGIDKIQVNSDSDEVLNIAKSMGVDTFKRDPKYATSETDGRQLYECLSDACTTGIMLIAFTPTPFIGVDDYVDSINLFLDARKNNTFDSLISVKKIKDYMFFENKPVNFKPHKTCKSQDLPNYNAMTFGITIVNTEYVRENHSIWTDKPIFYEVDELKAMDIDTNMDFFICEELYKKGFTTISNVDRHVNERITIPGIKKPSPFVPSDVYLGAVYDALNIVSDKAKDYVLNIKPTAGYNKIIHGPALTLKGRKIRKDENYAKMDNHRFQFYDLKYYENNPMVILESNDSIISHTGDITSTIFKKLGAVGYITDGIARDIELIEEVGFPVFSRGVNPIDAISNDWAYTDINVPIQIDNLLIYPDDYIFASKDGVVIIPSEIKDKFFIELIKILEKEREIRKFVKDTEKEELKSYIDDFIAEHGRF